MKIGMICGSPRLKDSTSMYLLRALKEKLEKNNEDGTGTEIRICHASGQNTAEPAGKEVYDSDVLILAFPLYVDSIPSNLLGTMHGILNEIRNKESAERRKPKVYLIVNNGFYDAVQNSIAIDQLWSWCGKCGFEKGYALAVGAGEMAQMSPLGHGPSVNLGNAVNRLAEDIYKGTTGETVYVEPNFPRFLYKMAAHSGWRMGAKKNGLKAAELRRRI